MTDTLEPISPTQAVELYLRDREKELAQASVQAHEYRLNHFIRWCDEQDIDNLNELTGRQLHEYKLWRRDDGDLNSVTVKTQMDTLRVFIRFCERIDAVHAELHDKVQSPSLTDGENQRDVLKDGDTAETILTISTRFTTPVGST